MDLVFNYALDVPPHDPEAVQRAVLLIDRIRVVLCHAALDRHSSAGVDRLAGLPPTAHKIGMSPLVKSRGPGQISGGAIQTRSPFTR
jgi:hypothetical protein